MFIRYVKLSSQNRYKERCRDIPHIDGFFKGVEKNVYRLDRVSIANMLITNSFIQTMFKKDILRMFLHVSGPVIALRRTWHVVYMCYKSFYELILYLLLVRIYLYQHIDSKIINGRLVYQNDQCEQYISILQLSFVPPAACAYL